MTRPWEEVSKAQDMSDELHNWLAQMDFVQGLDVRETVIKRASDIRNRPAQGGARAERALTAETDKSADGVAPPEVWSAERSDGSRTLLSSRFAA